LNRRPFLVAVAGAPLIATSIGLSDALAQTAANLTEIAPPELMNDQAGVKWIRSGTGVLKVFLFKVYDATLWIAQGESVSLKSPLALEMVYAIGVKAEDIIESSASEIARISQPSSETLIAWTKEMKRALPSVKSGDKLLGIHNPQQGARFFHNGTLTAAINDVEFSKAFFKIWLDQQTKRPELRKALLRSNAFDAI
jgi:hypothetical protein